MSSHPLYLQPVTLTDGRTGTIVDILSDDAFTLELSGATGLDGLITVHPDQIGGTEGIIARHYPTMQRIERGEGFCLELDDLSDDDFTAFCEMSIKERHERWGDFTTVHFNPEKTERFSRFLMASVR